MDRPPSIYLVPKDNRRNARNGLAFGGSANTARLEKTKAAPYQTHCFTKCISDQTAAFSRRLRLTRKSESAWARCHARSGVLDRTTLCVAFDKIRLHLAEEVEKVNPNLVVRVGDGKVMTVRYEAVNAMLLNEFLKEHRQVQELKATVAQQQEKFHAKIAQQQKQIEAITATVQKVNDKLALSKLHQS